MSRLILIRHGQASFHDADYDRLSERGRAQARRLAEWMLQTGVRPDAIYVGRKKRQQETAAEAASVFAAADGAWPEPRVLPGLDEVHFGTVVRCIIKERRAHDAELQEAAKRFVTMADKEEKPRAFVRLAQLVCRHWLEETEPIAGSDLWPDFVARVIPAFDQIRQEQGRGKTVAVFTSAGPISAMLQHGLNCPATTALSLWWRLANTSQTEFLFTEGQLTLRTFNSLPHLPDPRDWTYL